MNSCLFLLMILIFSFSLACFGQGGAAVNNFRDYVNKSTHDADNSLNEDMDWYRPTPKDSTAGQKERTDNRGMLRGIPSKWQGCRKDSECTAAVADCVSWEGINKDYLSRLFGKLGGCSASIDPGFQPQAACVAGSCQITTKTTDVSWDEWLSGMSKRR